MLTFYSQQCCIDLHWVDVAAASCAATLCGPCCFVCCCYRQPSCPQHLLLSTCLRSWPVQYSTWDLDWYILQYVYINIVDAYPSPSTCKLRHLDFECIGWVLGLHFHLTHSLLHFQLHLSWFQHCVCPYVLEVFVQLLKPFELPKCCLAASISKFGSFFSCSASWRFTVCFQSYMHQFQCLVWPCSCSTHLHASHICHLNTASCIPSTQIVCVHTMVSALFDVFGGSISSFEWLPYHSTHPFHFQDRPYRLCSLTHYAHVLAQVSFALLSFGALFGPSFWEEQGMVTFTSIGLWKPALYFPWYSQLTLM